MSDTKYQKVWSRRARLIILVGGLVLTLACLITGTLSVFNDSCTKSFERAPEAVVRAYVSAVNQVDPVTVVNCWAHNDFYEINRGCNEMCLQKVIGNSFRVLQVNLSEPFTSDDGRGRLRASMIVGCQFSEEQHIAEILLDTRNPGLPWAHWKIIESNFGGDVGTPWCPNPNP